MSKLERLGSLDLTWLQIERDTNLMHVVGVLLLETPLDRQRLEERLQTRLLRLERFGQHVLRDSAGAVWESGQVDLNAHIVELTLPAGDERAALEATVGELAARPLDPTRPLWQLHLVRHYQQGSALIVRIHHCIADGIALFSVLRSLTDAGPDDETPPETPTGDHPDNFFEQLCAPLTRGMIESIKISGAFWAKYLSLMLNPQQVFDYARASAALALEIGKLTGLQDDSLTFLKGQPQGVKRVSWSTPLPEDAVQELADNTGTTTDAVLLACLSGALHDHLRNQGAPTASVELRTLMPVNLRNAEADDPLGNRSGLMLIELPVGIADPRERLAETHRRVDVFAKAYDTQRALGIFSLIGQTPKAVQQQTLRLLAAKTSALLCHVQGSRQARYLAGAKIVEEMFWSPASGDLGLAISIVYYNGHYQVGLLSDAAMVAEPSTITSRIPAQFTALAPDANMAPEAPKPKAASKPRRKVAPRKPASKPT